MHEANKRAAAEVNQAMNAALRAGRQPSTTVSASPQNQAMNSIIRGIVQRGQVVEPQEAPEQQQAAPVTQDSQRAPATPPGNAGSGYADHQEQRRAPGMNDLLRGARYRESGGGAYSETGKQLS